MGYKSEKNYFVLRACLEFIMHQHIDSAKYLMETFWTEPDESGRLFLNLVRFVIEGCERKDVEILKAVKAKYARLLARDPSLNNYLHQIAVRHTKKGL